MKRKKRSNKANLLEGLKTHTENVHSVIHNIRNEAECTVHSSDKNRKLYQPCNIWHNFQVDWRKKKTLCIFTYCPIRLELDRLRKCFPVLWVKWIRWSVSGWRDGVCLFNIYILCQRFSHRWCALIHPSPLNTVRHSRLSECLWIFEFIWLQKECAEIFSLRWCLKTQILSPALVLDQ